jgi:hypothetical protein
MLTHVDRLPDCLTPCTTLTCTGRAECKARRVLAVERPSEQWLDLISKDGVLRRRVRVALVKAAKRVVDDDEGLIASRDLAPFSVSLSVCLCLLKFM